MLSLNVAVLSNLHEQTTDPSIILVKFDKKSSSDHSRVSIIVVLSRILKVLRKKKMIFTKDTYRKLSNLKLCHIGIFYIVHTADEISW